MQARSIFYQLIWIAQLAELKLYVNSVACDSIIKFWIYRSSNMLDEFYRSAQTEYNTSEELQQCISSKQVRCMAEGCCFQSTLAEYLLHSHGKDSYSNTDVDFSCLRSALIRPLSAAENGGQAALPTSIHSQLLQVTTATTVLVVTPDWLPGTFRICLTNFG